MPTISETINDPITRAAHKATRTASAVAEATADAIDAAKRTGKQFSDATEDFFDDTALRIKRHPIETVVMSFAAGVFAGMLFGWILGRK